MAIINITLSLVIFLNLLLGFFAFLQDRKPLLNRFFYIMCFIAAVWTFANFMTGVYATPFWLESTYAFGALATATGLAWVFILTENRFSALKTSIIYVVGFFFFIASFFAGFIAKNYEEIYSGGAFTGQSGYGLILYAIAFLIASIVAIYKITNKYRKVFDANEKAKLKYVLYGTIATLCISFITSFLFPLLNIYQFSGLDSVGFLIFLTCLSYTVIKYRLLNIRVISTELFTFSIWIILLIKFIYSDNFNDYLLNGVVFTLVILFGIFLIKSVIKEVRQREQIAKMAEDVRRAYVIEKEAKEELQTLDKIKNQFLAQTQHDLRTPLGIIRNYCDLLIDGTFGKQTKKAVEVLKRIQVVAENKLKDVNNFLDTTQFQLGKKVVSLKPDIELNTIVDEIIVDLKPQADGKKIYLQLHKPSHSIVVEADREKLKAALFNIIDNSIKYTPQGGVKVTIEDNPDNISIVVTDTGIGVPKEKLDSLFNNAFERGEQAQKTFATGKGIGLYLSGQIIKAHNGKTWVESEGEGKGSVFHVQLPKKKLSNK